MTAVSVTWHLAVQLAFSLPNQHLLAYQQQVKLYATIYRHLDVTRELKTLQTQCHIVRLTLSNCGRHTCWTCSAGNKRC